MKKLKNLHLRLTEKQHQGIVDAAQELGITPTTWARMKLMMAVEASVEIRRSRRGAAALIRRRREEYGS